MGASVDRIALITGANKGIGFEIARGLAVLGHEVLIGARDPERGRTATERLLAEGLPVQFLQIDIEQEAAVHAAAGWIDNRFGRLDILVNNAAVKFEFAPSPPSQASLRIVRQTFETNVFGTMAVIQAMLPLMRRSVAGRIVNVSSGLGSLSLSTTGGTKYQAKPLLSYNVAKSAVNSLTVQFANELLDSNIKVNAVDPGYTSTDMTLQAGGRTAEQAAAIAIRLATIPDDGPTAGFFDERGPLPW